MNHASKSAERLAVRQGGDIEMGVAPELISTESPGVVDA
jgi:hypothetical protein